MKIRCKKCFKKYDDFEGECPRCGMINDRDYSIPVKGKPLKHQNYVETLESLKNKHLLKSSCHFCNSLKLNDEANCPYCHSTTTLEGVSSHEDTDVLDQLVKETLNTEGFFNKKILSEKLREKGYLLDDWQPPYNYKFGIPRDINLMLFFVFLGITLLLPVTGGTSGVGIRVLVGLILASLVAGVLYLFRHHFFKEYIVFSRFFNKEGVEFSWLEKPEFSRDGWKTLLHLKNHMIKKIEVEVNPITFESTRMTMFATEDSKVSSKVSDINVSQFRREGNFELFMLIFALKYDVPLYIKKLKISKEYEDKSTTETIPKIFVRIDERLPGCLIEDELFTQHIEYLNTINDEKGLTGGGFEGGGGMIIFTASDDLEAGAICDNDPLVMKNKITYVLKEWSVVISGNNIYSNRE